MELSKATLYTINQSTIGQLKDHRTLVQDDKKG
jgi:hypothetical protein